MALAEKSLPKPIDPRAPRFNQSILATALVVGFLFQWWYVAPIFALVLFLGAAFGPRYGPFLRIYGQFVRPRLGPPKELEDPRPPRFAATIGVVFLSAATVCFATGLDPVGWVLGLIVAALAALSAVTGICVGCEVYLWIARRRHVQLVA